MVIPGSYHGPPRPSKPGIGSPISFLQSKLSKKIRRRQEFLKKRAELENSQSARARYSAAYVHEITGIEDEKELEEFMEYCKFSDIWLADVNDYDLIVAINQCYKDFRSNDRISNRFESDVLGHSRLPILLRIAFVIYYRHLPFPLVPGIIFSN